MFRQLRRGIYSTSEATRLSEYIRRSTWRRNRLVVLCYHGVCDSDLSSWCPGLFISKDRFRRRLELLREMDCTMLPLGEALQRVGSGTLPPRSVAITFDDGFTDLTRVAWPILQEFGFPTTLYLTSHYSGRQLPVFNIALRYMLWRSHGRHLDWPEILPRPVLIDGDGEETVDLAVRAYALRQDFGSVQEEELLRELAAKLNFNYAELSADRRLHIISPEEATFFASSGGDLQLHTHRHRSPLDRAAFFEEVATNRDFITELSGKPAEHFAYPSGFHHRVQYSWLAELGVRSATTCCNDYVTRKSESLALPRFLDNNLRSELEFSAWVSGTVGLLPSRKPPVGESFEQRDARIRALVPGARFLTD